LLGILSQITFADMTLSIAENIWLGWWLGDYVGAIVLGPLFVLTGCSYFSHLIEPDDSFLLHHSKANSFFPSEISMWLPWALIVLLPSMIAIARVEFDNRIPIVLAFLIALLPIAVLSTRNSWGVLVSATVLSSVLIITTVKYIGMLGDAINYQATLLAMAVSSLYLYDLVRTFELRAQELVDIEHSLSMASKLLTLNELGSNIAHELSTPLQIALSSSQRVRRRLEDRNEDWSVEINELNNVKDAINQANKTIVSVRSLVQKRPPDTPSCPISDALELSRKLSESTARKYGATINIKDISRHSHVEIDQSELTQILLNLISNSLLGTSRTANKEVNVLVRSVDDSSLAIEVNDSGKGVDASNLNSLFKFGHSHAIDGLGLGLWVSKSIALRRGGALDYIYVEDGDWCFRLTLNGLEQKQH